MIKRRRSKIVQIGRVKIGGGLPVAIQSMCTTKTEDVAATVAQIHQLEAEECDMVRVAVPHPESAAALREIKQQIKIPLIADIHFDYRLALLAIENGADKIRINPGNIGQYGDSATEKKMSEIIEAAKKMSARNAQRGGNGTKVAIRIGVNSGSLEEDMWKKYGRPCPEALVESALRWIAYFEKKKFTNLVIAIKSSDVPETIRAYELLAAQCDYPLHVGITEAGVPPYGTIKSAVGIGAILSQGIGDTIRVSIVDDPVEEIHACKAILKSLHLYMKEPEVIACPTCGRCEVDIFDLSRRVEEELKKRTFVRPPKVSVLGCAVNGPGEARESDWGIAGGRKAGAIFKRGKFIKSVPEDKLIEEFMALIDAEHE